MLNFADIREKDPTTLRKELLKYIEPNGFTLRVYFVAASGFLTDAYGIFATNVISPALAYVYWENDTGNWKSLVINEVTLVGTCIGMVLFGHLADRYGRKRLYGLELVIVIIATLGLTQVSGGYNQKSMDPFAWIIWWRFLLGIGIGAEYPLSALIAAEWSPTKARAKMLAAVFLMQPIGQFFAYGIGLLALRGISKSQNPPLTADDWKDHEKAAPVVDAVWRCVIGVGGIPALLAIALRLSIPETPRYLIDVDENLPAAVQATGRVYGRQNVRKNHLPAAKVQQNGASTSEHEMSVPSGRETAPVQNTSVVHGREAAHVQNTPVVSGRWTVHVQNQPTERPNGGSIAMTNVRHRNPSRNDSHPSEDIQSAPARGTSGQPRTQTEGEDEREIDNEIGANVVERQHSGGSGSGNGGPAVVPENGFWHDWTTLYHRGLGFRRALAGTSICWFLMDVCFYGLGLDNPRILAEVWAPAPTNTTVLYDWNSDLSNPNENIYDVLDGDGMRALYTISISSILGSVVFLCAVNYIPRVTALRWMFFALAGLFVITGASLWKVYETNDHSETIVLYTLSLLILNLGPNTITFMLPAELFPTKYRGTCYGIAAMSGKMGAILIQLVVHFSGVSSPKSGGRPLAIMLMTFTGLMLLGALTAWVWIPEVQELRKPRKDGESYKSHLKMLPRSLEDISEDLLDGQTFGFSNHMKQLFNLRSTSEENGLISGQTV